MENASYMPVDSTVMDYLAAEKNRDQTRLFYFGEGAEVLEKTGKVSEMSSADNFIYFLQFADGDKVRIDRIISYNLKPGPAFDEYDAYALECLTCRAGYDFES